MIVTCDETYWKFMPLSKPDDAPCGRTYDDAECSTICPHEKLPKPMTPEEQKEFFKRLDDLVNKPKDD